MLESQKHYFMGNRKFSFDFDNKARWKVIRDVGQKCHSTSPDVDVNVLNDTFVNIIASTHDSGIYDDLYFVPRENPFSFRCVNQLEAFECLYSVKSNAIGSVDLHPLFKNNIDFCRTLHI